MSKPRAVILAAGFSSRMGTFKPLLDIGGRPALLRLLDVAEEAGVREAFVVLGHMRDEAERALRMFRSEDARRSLRAHPVFNANYADGMFSSVRAGISATTEGSAPSAILLFPADVPLIPARVVEEVIAAQEKSPDSFIVPCFRGKKGHPLLIPASHLREILEHDGSSGLKSITDKYDERIIRLETEEEAVVLDMDTREAYEEMLRYRDGIEKPRRAYDFGNFGGRLILVRHGSTIPHRERIFLGQTDVPLSEKGRAEAREAARKLAALNVRTDRIYASDLSRAEETARIIAEALSPAEASAQIVALPQFRELHLGDWDGKFIDEIRAVYPEEYERRGENILQYKRGTKAENYYDLQYRTMKALKRVLTDEEAKGASDVVIVAHAGTIRVIRANAEGISLEAALREDIPRGSVHIVAMRDRQ